MRTVTRRRTRPTPESANKLIETAIRRISDKGSLINEDAAVSYLPQIKLRQRTTIFLPAGEVCEKAAASLSEDISLRTEIRPIIIVEDDFSKQGELIQWLKQLADAFRLEDSSSAMFSPMIRLPAKQYLCPKRFKNMKKNAGHLLRGQYFYPLLTDSIPSHLADKVCVKQCFSDCCSNAPECAYAKHIKNFKIGRYKFQIYSQSLYKKAWADGEIPMKSIIIGDRMNGVPCKPDTLTLQLSERELALFAHLSCFVCRSNSEIRYFVEEDAARIEQKAKKLFDKLCNGNRKVYLKEIVQDISGFTERISNEAYSDLKNNRFWLRYYKKIHKVLPIIMQATTCLNELEVDTNRRSFTFCVPVSNADDKRPLIS